MALRGAGLLIPLVWGLLAGWWTPRGPVTTTEALASIAISAAAGVLAGRLTRSRWAMLLAPVLFSAAVEIVRIGYVGPTVDHPHFSALGVLALLVGRGVHGLLALLPMLVGAAYGAGWARRRAGRSSGWFRRGVVGLLAAVVLLIAVAVAIPARTPAIAGGVAELTTVDGMGVLIRGARPEAPVLLFLAASPGGSDMGVVRKHLAALEQHFIVAVVDRRGGGNSYGALDPTATLTLADEVSNTLTMTDFLRARFHRDKIYLLGHSGSSLPAVLAVQAHPEFYYAYVGAGQGVDLTASDRSQYADTVAWARANGKDALVKQLTKLGPPPYDTIYDYEPLLLSEGSAFAYPGGIASGEGQTANFSIDEHSLLDKVHVYSGFLDCYGLLYPRERDVDLRTRVTRLAVPVYFVEGAHDVPGRLSVMNEWFAALQAPHKELVTFPDAGHLSLYEDPERFVAVLVRVREETA